MARPNTQRFNYKAKPERVEILTEGIEGTPAVELPFLLGVMADLSGANNDSLPDVEERSFYEGLDDHDLDLFLLRIFRVRFGSLSRGCHLQRRPAGMFDQGRPPFTPLLVESLTFVRRRPFAGFEDLPAPYSGFPGG